MRLVADAKRLSGALNGWQRLWIVASICWIAYVGTMLVEDLRKAPELHRNLLSARYMRELGVVNCLREHGTTTVDKIEAELRAQDLPAMAEELNRLDYNPVTPEVRRRRLRAIGLGVTSGIVPPLLVYGTGLVLVWIISGFRAKPS